MPFPLRPLLNGAIVAGLVLAAWPLGQNVYGRWNQHVLEAQWRQQSLNPAAFAKSRVKTKVSSAMRSETTRPETRHDADSPTLVRAAPGVPRARWPLTKLSIPDIGLETFVVNGVDAASLRRGPGHDPNSSLPGWGNCVIAGHRNVYGSFFYRLDELFPGSRLTLENRDGTFTYIVDSVFSTPDSNLAVLQPPSAGTPPLLTLITCTLPHSNNRIILRATLQS